MLKKVKFFLEELRAPFFTASIIPVVLGTIMAWTKTNKIQLDYFLLSIAGGILLHAGTNIANDYFDHKSKNDELNKEYIRPFTGGSRLIQKGLLSPKEVLIESLVCFALASLIGVYLVTKLGYMILVFGIIGIISGFFYTAPPINWVSRGIGELLVGLNFGALMCLGAFFVQTRTLSLEPVLASIPVSLLITAVLYINEFPDYNADRAVGKNNLVVRLGKKKAVIGYALIILFTYSSIALTTLLKITPLFSLLAIATLPLAIETIRILERYKNESSKLIPACANTIKLHLIIGLILSISYLSKLIGISN